MSKIKVTIEDLEDGTMESAVIENDYILICAGNRFLDHTQVHKNGTHVLTVKV